MQHVCVKRCRRELPWWWETVRNLVNKPSSDGKQKDGGKAFTFIWQEKFIATVSSQKMMLSICCQSVALSWGSHNITKACRALVAKNRNMAYLTWLIWCHWTKRVKMLVWQTLALCELVNVMSILEGTWWSVAELWKCVVTIRKSRTCEKHPQKGNLAMTKDSQY